MAKKTPESEENSKALLGRAAWRLVILLGMVSLFADMTYEGARSITGPYLADPLVFLWGNFLALVGSALWGMGVGAQESIMRAAVAGMAPTDRRGTAYGVFNTGYGLLWFAGSVLMGVLYDVSVPSLVVFSVLMQLASVPLFLLVQKEFVL